MAPHRYGAIGIGFALGLAMMFSLICLAWDLY